MDQGNSQHILCGVDLMEYETLQRDIYLGAERFLQRIYTEREQVYCAGRIPCLAARFAAKEAVSKALGTGMRGIGFTEIEIGNDDRGRPLLYLSGRAAAVAELLRIREWSISLSHAEHFAVAIAIALRQDLILEAQAAEDISVASISARLKAFLEQPDPS